MTVLILHELPLMTVLTKTICELPLMTVLINYLITCIDKLHELPLLTVLINYLSYPLMTVYTT